MIFNSYVTRVFVASCYRAVSRGSGIALVLALLFAANATPQSRGPDWARIRTAVTAIFGWKIASPVNASGDATFFDVLQRQNGLFLRNIEGSSRQKVSSEISKNLDHRLTPDERTAVKNRLRSTGQRLVAYEDLSLPTDETKARKIFEFTKELNVETLVTSPAPAALPMLDRLATEFGINIAILDRDPSKVLKSLEGRSTRMGACADTGIWLEEGIKPAHALALLKDRLIGVRLRDRSTLGKNGRDVVLGAGVGAIREFVDAIYRAKLTPSLISIAPISSDFAELSRSYDFLEGVLQGVTADRVAEIGRTTPIRGTDRIRPQDRERTIAAIQAAVPA